jgi:predicted transcriptional regulator
VFIVVGTPKALCTTASGLARCAATLGETGRWNLELLKALCGAGPVSIREAARRVELDMKAVHGDVTALLNAGVLDRTEDGHIVFPFEAVKVEFLLQAA